MPAAIEKNTCRRGAVRDQSSELLNGARPQRTLPLFATFAADFHRATRQVQFADEQLCSFLGASSGVVEKQQQSVVATALGGLAIWDAQQRIHLRFVQIGNDCLAGLFERNGTDLAAPSDVFRTVLSHEASQSMNRGQPLVPSGDRTLPHLFQIGQEESHQIRRHIGHGEPVHGLVQLAGNERNQQGKGIAVTTLRVACQITLGYQVFRASADGPARWRARTRGYLNKVSNTVGSPV
jgi:hypothetical protein